MKRLPVVAIVGQPNVGKSTLFNRLTRTRAAIVDDHPGVTRDRHLARMDWNGVEFRLMDTGGYVPDSKDLFDVAIREQVDLALAEADVLLLLCNVQTGVTRTDEMMARRIRSTGKPFLLVVNKVDNDKLELETGEFWALGLDEPLAVAANSGRHTGDLLDHIVGLLPELAAIPEDQGLRVAIIGRPNVGKSSLVNRLLGDNRVLVTPVAGTTRDSIDTPVTVNGRKFVLVDTAGLRRRTKIKENIEFYSRLRTLGAIENAQICMLLVEPGEGLTRQDIQVLEEAVQQRKGVAIVVNKWDTVDEKQTNTARDMEREMLKDIHTLRWVPVLFISALTGQRAPKVLELAERIAFNRARWLDPEELREKMLAVIDRRPPPAREGNWIRFRDVIQVRTDPPWIVFRVNHPDLLTTVYHRYLENQLRRLFEFEGVPLRLDFRRGRFIEAESEDQEDMMKGVVRPKGPAVFYGEAQDEELDVLPVVDRDRDWDDDDDDDDEDWEEEEGDEEWVEEEEEEEDDDWDDDDDDADDR